MLDGPSLYLLQALEKFLDKQGKAKLHGLGAGVAGVLKQFGELASRLYARSMESI